MKLSPWSFIFAGFGSSQIVIGLVGGFTPLRTIIIIGDFIAFIGMNAYINLKKKR